MLAVTGIVDRRRPAGGGEESELVQGDAIEGWKEDFAEAAVGERLPELAPRTRRRSECHLAAWAPHRGRAWTSWCLHRTLSMKGARGR